MAIFFLHVIIKSVYNVYFGYVICMQLCNYHDQDHVVVSLQSRETIFSYNSL